MPDYNIDVYNPDIAIDDALFAHIILWWPLMAFLFIYAAELLRFGCKCENKCLVKYKKYYYMVSNGIKIDSGVIAPNSVTVEPIKTECTCGAKNNEWYLVMWKVLIFLSFLIPFYGYYVSSEYYIFHIGMLTWCSIWFLAISILPR